MKGTMYIIIILIMYIGVTACDIQEMDGRVYAGHNKTLFTKQLSGTTGLSIKFGVNITQHFCCPLLYISTSNNSTSILETNFDNSFALESITRLELPNTELNNATPCRQMQGTIVCNGIIHVQFSTLVNVNIGYPCSNAEALNFSYSVIYETQPSMLCKSCLGHTSPLLPCNQFYNNYSLYSYFGMEEKTISSYLAASKTYSCYQHAEELMCKLMCPQCIDHTIKPPCKQMCLDFMHGCEPSVNNVINLNCDRFPTKNCTYREVTCPDLELSHGYVTEEYDGDVIRGTFQCKLGYRLQGSRSSSCFASGKWRPAVPICVDPGYAGKFTNNMLVIGGAIPGLMLVIAFAVAICRRISVKYTCFVRITKPENVYIKHFKSTRHLVPRKSLAHGELMKKDYDMFLMYSSNDYHIVKNNIAVSIEENTSFKLCVADRDFHAGKSIIENVKDAVTKSRGAIIVVSQNFIDSDWCKFEFCHAYHKAIEERTFHLVIVLLQKFECLVNVPPLLADYYQYNTCIRISQPKFCHKLQHVVSKKLKESLNFLKSKEALA